MNDDRRDGWEINWRTVRRTDIILSLNRLKSTTYSNNFIQFNSCLNTDFSLYSKKKSPIISVA